MRAFSSLFRQCGRAALLLLTTTALLACDPIPSRQLTTVEKQADLHWLFAIFDQNYAPLEYKATRRSFDYQGLKERYLEEAAQTQDNEAFYQLLHRFVAEFADAHTGGMFISAGLPGRTQVAYLGFAGVRQGDVVVVQEFLPTVNTETFPIKKDDKVLALDGVSLREIVESDRVRLRDLGQPEANLTMHMERLFYRTPLSEPLPEGYIATLRIQRGEREFDVRLPWIRRDLETHLDEQANAAAAQHDEDGAQASQRLANRFRILKRWLEGGVISQTLSLPGFTGREAWDHFEFVDTMPTWTSHSVLRAVERQERADFDAFLRTHPEVLRTAALTNRLRERVSEVREVPETAVFIPEAQTFPVYVTTEYRNDEEGNATEDSALVATIHLNTFGIGYDAVEEMRATLRMLQGIGVKNVVIDMINNGGGSLIAGLQLAALFSNEPIQMPQIQFKVSESWINTFERTSIYGMSDPERFIAGQVATALKQDRDAGLALSRPFEVDVMSPFTFSEPNTELEAPFKVAVLVNEICASMCDIFAAVLQDNDLATVVGQRTMGAGGNVVMHGQAPNSHFWVNQTESLILRADGSYLENAGVTPDVEADVNAAVLEKYKAVRDRGVQVLLSQR